VTGDSIYSLGGHRIGRGKVPQIAMDAAEAYGKLAPKDWERAIASLRMRGQEVGFGGYGFRSTW
jgi:hypothetical protein